MKVLIVSCAAGGGCTSVAVAVEEKLREHGHETTSLDLRSLAGEKTCKIRWNLFRHQQDIRSESRMQQYLQDNEFDVIVVTHVLAAVVLSLLNSGQMRLPKMIYVGSDYCSVPFIEDTCCDYYVIPSEKLTAEFCRKGILKEKILPAGIPVKKEFLTGMSSEEAREAVKMPGKDFRILLWAENIRPHKLMLTVKSVKRYLDRHPEAGLTIAGIGKEQIYSRLSMVCGGDSRILLAEDESAQAVLMKACDVMIAGSNGPLAAEAAVLGVPLVQLIPSNVNERHNAEFFARYGMSMAVKRPGAKLYRALELLRDEQRRSDMVNAQHLHISQLAAAEICSLAEATMMTVEAGSASLLV